jgi:hypothetical protein
MRHIRFFVVTVLLVAGLTACASEALQKLKESYRDSVSYQPVAQ